MSASTVKAGLFLLSVLTSLVLVATGYYLFKGSNRSKLKESRTTSFLYKLSGHRSTIGLSEPGGAWDNILKRCSNYSKSGRSFSHQQDCGDSLCTKYLSEVDRRVFHQCQKSSIRRFITFLDHQSSSDLNKSRLVSCLNRTDAGDILATGSCRFMNGEGRGMVGLVSFPGSGNTWVRGLLQSATGFCTGAVFCDASLRMGGFDGEGLQSSSVLVVKSHAAVPAWNDLGKQLQSHAAVPAWNDLGKQFRSKDRELRLKALALASKQKSIQRVLFDSVILLVRNPFHALVSEWNRQLSSKYSRDKQTSLSHTETHGQQFFLENGNWSEFVHKQIGRWKKTFTWLGSGRSSGRGREVLVVRYEDIVSGVELQVRRMLDFLHINVTGPELSQRLRDSVQQFQRPRGTEFDHFTSEQRELVNSNIREAWDTLTSWNWNVNLLDYLRTHQL